MCAQVHHHKDVASRALKEASERKAKKVHFYQNGRPYAPRLTVSLISGKDFHTFEQLCQFLTDKSQLLNGVQYIFTTNGKRVATLDELEHGQSYVISGSSKFMPYPYGIVKPVAPRISRISNRYKLVREDDLRLLRPLSSKYNNVYANANNHPVGCILQNNNNPDCRMVTIVNNQNHSITSRVILNLKSPKSFDNLLRDLGQAVRMHLPKRMFTSSGLEVKSVSHLKHDLSHIDLFYIDSEYHHERFQLITKFPSLESIEKFFESSVQRLNQISSHSSNIDLRPHNIASDSSLSNFESDKQWQRSNNVTTYQIGSLPRKKSNIPIGKQGTINKPKNVKLKTSDTRQKSQSFSGPRSDKDLRKRSISREKDHSQAASVPQQQSLQVRQKEKEEEEAPNVFSIDNISNSKYEQIQQYAERMLQETENQIKNEGLFQKYSQQQQKRNRPGKSSLSQTTSSPESSKNVPLLNKPKSRISVTETPNNINLNAEEKDIAQVKTPPKVREEIAKIEIDPVIEAPIVKKTIEVQNKSQPSVSTNGKVSSKQIHRPLTKMEKKSAQSENASIGSKSLPAKNQRTDAKNVVVAKTNETTPLPKATGRESNVKAPKDSKSMLNKKTAMIKAEKHLHKGANVPTRYLELSRVYGYSGQKSKNLFYLNTGELVFTCGVFAVLWNPDTDKQRFYAEHDNDIYCMRVCSKSQFVASSQMLAGSKVSVIRIWSIKNLSTVTVLKDRLLNLKITDMEFTVSNSLFVVSNESKLAISVWNWNAGKVIANTSKTLDKDELVCGGTVHPQSNDIMVTYGKMHLVVWHLHKDKTIDYRTALQTHSKISKTVHCADFLGDNSLLTGDSNGNLTIWAPFEVNNVLEFAIKEVKGHEAQLTCLKLTGDHILISGDSKGAIKTWDVSDGEFRLLGAIKLSSLSGSVCSIALLSENNENLDIYVGTSENFILKGSALQSTSYDIVFEGHLMAIRTVSFDPTEDLFYTASLDQKVCKWSEHGLIWRVCIDVQAISSAVHPSGQVLAIGSVNGIVSIISATGEVVQHLEISSVCIGCMSFSSDGNFLVAGCQDGNLHVLPASDNGYSYSKVSILKGPLPILTLQWSLDTQFILTSVDDNNYQELILWDLHNTRYIRNVTNFSDNLHWYNPTCSGLEDARGTWDNVNLHNVINICNHYSPSLKYILTGDENGYIRLFSYPCLQTTASFFEYKQGGGSVTDIKVSPNETFIVACNFEGAILIWSLKEYNSSIIKT